MKKLIMWDGMTVAHIGGNVKPLLPWQICHTVKIGKKTVCDGVATVYAVSISDVYAMLADDMADLVDDMDDMGDDGDIIAGKHIVYPLIKSVDDADGVNRLAGYARRQAWKWDLGNDYAAMSAINRSIWDTEDETSDAVLAVIESLHDNPDAPMVDHYHKARAYLERKKRGLYRKNEHEYNPENGLCKPFGRKECPTDYHMTDLVKSARKIAGLTDKQEDITKCVSAGLGQKEICELLNMGKPLYYRHKYNALLKLYKAMVALDTIIDDNGDIKYWDMSAYGLTDGDIMDTWTALEEKADSYSNGKKKKK